LLHGHAALFRLVEIHARKVPVSVSHLSEGMNAAMTYKMAGANENNFSADSSINGFT